eukprot:CAMPEP_0116150292 /NCGR_PEP_ID=MMETSP0329-20121206/19462_1 /TAXON_ID=697910 /ORGANISM="Pseudo-nitzschia arenysensis, Strain B593" /LENGTH=486 /DNA_ID=CAMNT_0003646781 /DNA_START=162 /DNA_END=1622 /DNA_ORIENTATION=-
MARRKQKQKQKQKRKRSSSSQPQAAVEPQPVDRQAQLIAALQAQRAQLQAQRAQLEAQRAQLEAQNAQLQARNAQLQAQKNGTYFALIDDIFEPVEKTHCLSNNRKKESARELFKEVCRGEDHANTCSFKNGKEDGIQQMLETYRITLEKANEANDSDAKAAYANAQSRSGSHSTKMDSIWQKGIFGETGYSKGDIAHLVPASSQNANTYWFVADFLFGYNEKRSWEKKKRLIHGTNNTEQERFKNTGIKHSVPNKIMLAGQRKHFDERPNVVIIPILTVEEAKTWIGGAYDAIVLIDASNRDRRDIELSTIGSDTHFKQGDLTNLATKAEVQKAHALVKKYTNAIIGAQRHFAPTESRIDDKGKPNAVDSLFDSKNIQYSDTELSWKGEPKVRKIGFTSHSEEGHPAPDPILLVTRAAVQLQRRKDFLLVAVDEDWDDDVDELSALAEDLFLWKRKQLQDFELQQQMLGRDIVFDSTTTPALDNQ